jgi:hypothetical protein
MRIFWQNIPFLLFIFRILAKFHTHKKSPNLVFSLCHIYTKKFLDTVQLFLHHLLPKVERSEFFWKHTHVIVNLCNRNWLFLILLTSGRNTYLVYLFGGHFTPHKMASPLPQTKTTMVEILQDIKFYTR